MGLKWILNSAFTQVLGLTEKQQHNQNEAGEGIKNVEQVKESEDCFYGGLNFESGFQMPLHYPRGWITRWPARPYHWPWDRLRLWLWQHELPRVWLRRQRWLLGVRCVKPARLFLGILIRMMNGIISIRECSWIHSSTDSD
ncbi:hypothetical protein SDJN03_25101, partial [Cucurbita argyrosperma subsp. sororia]